MTLCARSIAPSQWDGHGAVVIAQRVSKRLIAIARTVHRNPFPSGSKHTLDGSFVNLSDGDSLIESYIDDVFGVCAGWEKHDVITLYQTITKIFAEHGLPRHLTKSSPLDSPISSSIPFLGWVWNLLEGIVYPPPEKICHLQESISSIHSSTVSTKVLLTFLGKVVWFSLARRPLLAALNDIFTHHSTSNPNIPANPTVVELRELNNLATLLPLSIVNLRLPWAHLVISADACLSGAAVVYHETSPAVAQHLYTHFLNASPNARNPPDASSPAGIKYIRALRDFCNGSKWQLAFTHKWKRTEHISSLEASILTSAVQWAVSRGLQSQQFLLLTDSSASLGALNKGRSSVPGMLARCRKSAALALAHDVHPRIAFIPTDFNPADGPSRTYE